MAIKAIGATPRMALHATSPERESHRVPKAEAGDVNATPKTDHVPDEGSERQGKHEGLHGRSHVQQTLQQLDRVVRHKIKDAAKTSELDAQGRHEIRRLAHDFKVDLEAVYKAAAEEHLMDTDVLVEGVSDAIATLTNNLRITLQDLLPDVPWEPEIPPEPDNGEGGLDVPQKGADIDIKV